MAAASVGAPDPWKTPKFAVEENLRPDPAVPPAGIAVAFRIVIAPLRDDA